MYIKRRILKPILQSLKQGAAIHSACQAANLNCATFWRWRKNNPKLDNLINKIIESRIQIVEDALFKSAISGNVTAQIFFLKNRGDWRDVQEFKGNGFGETKILIIRPEDKKVKNGQPKNRVKALSR